MSDPALSPAQLDRLEDALEDLEHSGIPAALLDPNDADARPVADALEVYRSILVMSREALPAQDVPAGILDDVLAEARRAAAAPAEPTRRRVPWWRRLGGWGPAVAFAGTAALLVVLVRPPGEDAAAPVVAQRELAEKSEAPAAASLEGEARQEEAPADAAPEADALEQDMRLAEAQARAEEKDGWGELGGEGSELRGGAIDTAQRSRAHSEPAADPAVKRDADDDAPAATTKKSATTSSSSDKKPKGGRAYDPEPTPNAAPKPAKKAAPVTGSAGAPGASTPSQPATPPAIPIDDEETKSKKEVAPDGWDDIATGDAKRRAGACSSAKVAYQRAREDDAAEVRARALAGLGLCELQAGNASTAEGLFAKARATDPKVGKLIESERARHEPKDQAQYEQADETPAP